MDTTVAVANALIEQQRPKLLHHCPSEEWKLSQPGRINRHSSPIACRFQPLLPKRHACHHVGEQPLQLTQLSCLQGLGRQPLAVLELIEQRQ